MGDPSAGMMVVSQRHRDQPEASVSGGSNMWGTWEELLLASAVKRHGTDNWNSVSLELQARARAHSAAPLFYTAEACRSKYYAIKRRYCGDEERDAEVGNNMPWFEELRKLRVAHLKREVEMYDGSIGSLEIKLKRLKAERSQAISKQFGSDAFDAPPVKRVQATDTGIRGCVSQPCNQVSEDFSSDAGALPRHEPSALVTCRERREERVEVRNDLKEETLEFNRQLETRIQRSCSPCPGHDSLINHLVGVQEPERSGEKVEVAVPHDQKLGGMGRCETTEWRQSMAAQDAQVVDSNKEGSTDPQDDSVVQIASSIGDQSNGAVIEEKLVIGKEDKTTSAELSSGSGDADVYQPSLCSQTMNYTIRQTDESCECEGEGRNLGLGSVKEVRGEINNTMTHKSWKDSASRLSDEKPGNFVVEDNSGDRNCEDGDADHLQVDNHRGGMDLLGANCYFSGNKEVSLPCVGSHEKPHSNLIDIQRLSGGVKEPAISSLPLPSQSKSAHLDGVEGLPNLEIVNTSCSRVPIQKAVANNHTVCASIARNPLEDVSQPLQLESNKHIEARGAQKPLPPRPIEECKHNLSLESADSTEHGGTTLGREGPSQDEKDVQNLEIKGGFQSLASSELTTSEPLRFKGRQKNGRSIESMALLEVSGDSVEVANRRESVRSKVQGRKRKLKISTTNDLGSACKDGSEATDSIKLAETSERTTGSITTSHERSGSMNEDDKECEEAEGWQQHTGGYSGDSQVEKSEAGSLMDGNEDISPMSRRHRREPKVAGKLLPLLECLRRICAHKCAPLFKHKQETQEHSHYDHLIRSYIDLTLIRARLEEGFYSGSVHFFRDLLLMINNALVYYSRESQEFTAATGLRECIKTEMSQIFETEALLKQDRPSTRKRVPKRHSNSAAAGSSTPGKQQGRKRGRTPVREPPISDMIAKSGAQSKGGATATTTDEDGVGHKTLITDKKRRRDRDFWKAGKNFSLRVLEEEENKLTGLELESKPKRMGGTAQGRMKSLAKGLKENIGSGEANNRPNLVAVSDEAKAKAVCKTKVMDDGTKVAATMTKAPLLPSQQPVKRRVGRPPKHSQHQGFLEKTKDEEEEATNYQQQQQKKKMKR